MKEQEKKKDEKEKQRMAEEIEMVSNNTKQKTQIQLPVKIVKSERSWDSQQEDPKTKEEGADKDSEEVTRWWTAVVSTRKNSILLWHLTLLEYQKKACII